MLGFGLTSSTSFTCVDYVFLPLCTENVHVPPESNKRASVNKRDRNTPFKRESVDDLYGRRLIFLGSLPNQCWDDGDVGSEAEHLELLQRTRGIFLCGLCRKLWATGYPSTYDYIPDQCLIIRESWNTRLEGTSRMLGKHLPQNEPLTSITPCSRFIGVPQGWSWCQQAKADSWFEIPIWNQSKFFEDQVAKVHVSQSHAGTAGYLNGLPTAFLASWNALGCLSLCPHLLWDGDRPHHPFESICTGSTSQPVTSICGK